jgi:hypothetical protein
MLHSSLSPLALSKKTIATLSTQISRLPSNSPARIGDQAAERAAQAQLSTLQQQIAALTNALPNTAGGQIITPAQPPDKPAGQAGVLACLRLRQPGAGCGRCRRMLTDRTRAPARLG